MKTGKILAILMALSLLAGCSAKAANDSADSAMMKSEYSMSYDAEYGYVVESTPAASGIYDTSENPDSSTDVSVTEQKIIKTVDVTAETEDMDTLLASIAEKVAELGGYMERQEVYNGSAYSSRRNRNADMTIRIPVEKLNGFMDQVAGLSNVVNKTESIDDVTLTYVATESRVKALETEEERLLELLAKAESMSDLLEIESRLTEVRYELESYTTQLLVLQNKVSYSTVNLYVSEVVEYTPVAEETVWQRISGGFMDSLEGIWNGVVEIFVFLAANLPYLVVIGAVGTVVVLRLLRSGKKRKNKVQPPKSEEAE